MSPFPTPAWIRKCVLRSLESWEGANKQENLQNGLCVFGNLSRMKSYDTWVGGKLQAMKHVANYLMELELTNYNFTRT
jgi:hypothetical protein